ncbi:hypothetical protein RCL1_003266 [Eukaryota sp. TZLM3-RCL]
MPSSSKRQPTLNGYRTRFEASLQTIETSFFPDGSDLQILNPFFTFLTESKVSLTTCSPLYCPCLKISHYKDPFLRLGIENTILPVVISILSCDYVSQLTSSNTSPREGVDHLLSFLRDVFPNCSFQFVSLCNYLDEQKLIGIDLPTLQSYFLINNTSLNNFREEISLNQWLVSLTKVFSQSPFKSIEDSSVQKEVIDNSIKSINKQCPSDSPQDTLARMLVRVPRLTTTGITSIVEKYQSFYNLMLSYGMCSTEDEKCKLLATLSAGKNCIGPVKSTRIYRILFGNSVPDEDSSSNSEED